MIKLKVNRLTRSSILVGLLILSLCTEVSTQQQQHQSIYNPTHTSSSSSSRINSNYVEPSRLPVPHPTRNKINGTKSSASSESPQSKADEHHDPSIEQHGLEKGDKEVEDMKEELTLRKQDPLGTSIMFVVGLLTTSLNFVSCGYLLYLVKKLSRRVGFHASLRLLAYSSVFDMFVGGFFTLSIVYSTLFGSLITGTGCQTIGFIINLLTASDMLLIGFISLATYTKVVHNFTIPRGRYDWILFAVVIGIPLFASCILANYHAFGPEFLWCLIDDETLAGQISTASTIVLYLVVGLLVTICYFLIKRNVKWELPTINLNDPGSPCQLLRNSTQDSRNTSGSGETKVYGDSHRYHRKSIMTLSYAELKVETHLIIHFLQYTPPCVHLMAMFFGYRKTWVFTLAILSTNLGGIFQLWAYLHHQKKKKSQFHSLYDPSPASSFTSRNDTFSDGDSRSTGVLRAMDRLVHPHRAHHPLVESPTTTNHPYSDEKPVDNNKKKGRYSVLSDMFPNNSPTDPPSPNHYQ